MPALLPVIGAALLAAGPLTLLGKVLAYGLIMSSAVFSARERRRAERAARAAWEASLRDRAVLVRSAELPRSLTYGRVQISGTLVYGKSIGALQDRLLLVIALRSGHEIDAYEQILCGEREIGALDGAGHPTGGPFVTTRSDVIVDELFTASGNATTAVVLSHTPVGLDTVTAQWATGSSGGDAGPSDMPLTIASLVGTTLTLNTVNLASVPLPPGTPIGVQYRRTQTTPWIRVRAYRGTSAQTADADAVTDSAGEWTANHRGRDVPALYIWLSYNPDIYPAGVENIKATVRGARIYDPRLDSTAGGSGSHRNNDPATWTWSRNPALITRSYLTHPLGFGCPASEIDDVLVASAANVCDELVTLYTVGTVSVTNGSAVVTGTGTVWRQWNVGQLFVGPDAVARTIASVQSATQMTLAAPYGGTTQSGVAYAIRQPRYLCDCDLSTESSRADNLRAILSSMAGWCVYTQGRWRVIAGAFSSPTLTLDETALADTESISVQSRVPRAQLVNAIKGVYVGPLNGWQPTDYPPVRNTTYEAQDGGERMEADLTMPATTDAWMAQRLAKIELERGRQALTVRIACNFRAYSVAAGSIIALTLSRYGWAAKPFRVIDREFEFARGVVLTLREESAGVYDWAHGEATAVDLAPNTDLPQAFAVPAMPAITLATGVSHVLITADGTVQPGIGVTWAAISDANVAQGGSIEVEWRALPAGPWTPLAPLSGAATAARIAPVIERVQYQVRVRAVTGVGVHSTWQVAAITAASNLAPAAPTALAVESLGGMRRYSISMASPLPLSLAGWQVRWAPGATITWSSATIVGALAYTPGAMGPFFLDAPVPAPAGTYSFEVRAVSTSGAISATGAQALNQSLTALRIAVGRLTASAVALAANADGTVPSFAAGTTTMLVSLDNVDDSSNWTYSRADGTGITSTINTVTGVVQVTAMSADTSFIDVTAARSGFASITLRFSVAKARAGATGPTGSTGSTGPTGQRGSQWFYISGQTAWSDSVATNHVIAQTGAVVVRDIVTMHGTGFAQTRFWNGSAWVQVTVAIDGSLLVNGTVVADALNVGRGTGNLVPNSGPPIDVAANQPPLPGWVMTWNAQGRGDVVGPCNWTDWGPRGFGTIGMYWGNYTPANGLILGDVRARPPGPQIGPTADSWLPVVAGQRYELSAYLGPHRCVAEVNVTWLNAAGAYLGENGGNGVSSRPGQHSPLASWSRSVVFAVAPAGTAFAIPGIRSWGAGQPDPYLFAAAVYFGEATANQTVPSPWAPGSNITAIDGAGIRTDSIDVDRLRAGSLAVGRFLQSQNYVAGTSGFRIHADGNAEFRQLAADIINTPQLVVGAVGSSVVVQTASQTIFNGPGVISQFNFFLPNVVVPAHGFGSRNVLFTVYGDLALTINFPASVPRLARVVVVVWRDGIFHHSVIDTVTLMRFSAGSMVVHIALPHINRMMNISGAANTFYASVALELRDGNGALLVDEITSAFVVSRQSVLELKR